MAAEAVCTVPPSALAGALMAKKTPGVSTHAAMSAMIPTSASISIPP